MVPSEGEVSSSRGFVAVAGEHGVWLASSTLRRLLLGGVAADGAVAGDTGTL